MAEIANRTLSQSSIPQPSAAASLSPCDPTAVIEVNVILQRPMHRGMTLQQYTDAVICGSEPTLSHEQYAAAFGVATADMDAVSAWTATHGLSESYRSASSGYVKLRGTIAQMQAAFGVMLHDVNDGSRTYRSYAGSVAVPADLAPKIMHVMGLDSYVTLVKHSRRYEPNRQENINAAIVSLTPTQVATAYQFPSGSGSGQAIGIIEVGGGYDTADVTNSFNRIGVAVPTLVDISVMGGINYGINGGASDETMLDIYCCGGVAHSATLYMYLAPDVFDLNTALTYIYDCVNQAVADNTHNPSVISVSYGFGQSYWDAIGGLVSSFETTFQSAVVKGISVFVASGDDGAQGRSDTAPSVGYPGGSPYCISCGGTRLQLSGSSISSETVWNQGNAGTGGGITGFALPSYQVGLGLQAYPYYSSNAQVGPGQTVTYRGAPDIASNSDPATGYAFYFGGSLVQYGGTSAAAPLLAGMAAVINANINGRIGFINSRIYTASSAFRDITSGNNCATGLQSVGWAAHAGWDACTGMGSPIGTAIQALYQTIRPSSGMVWPQLAVGSRPSTGLAWPRINTYAS